MAATPTFSISMASAPPAIVNSAGDSNNDIDFSAKDVLSDDSVVLTGNALTKQLDASWAVGDNAGGLDTGSVGANVWYSVWAIATASKVQDFLFSTSATAPTMPATYIYKRRIGWIKTNGSSDISLFRQEGDWFYWLTIPADHTSNPATAPGTLVTVSTPPNTLGKFSARVTETGTEIPTLSITPTWSSVEWPAVVSVKGPGGTGTDSGYVDVPVDGSQQVYFSRGAGSTPTSSNLYTVGWLDRRGRDD